MIKRLKIGGDRELVQPETPTELKFVSTESAHEAVNSFLIALMGFSALVDVWSPHSTSPATPWEQGHYAELGGVLCDVTLRLVPDLVVYSAVLNGIPHEIKFEQYATVRETDSDDTVRLGALGPFLLGISTMLVVSYFEAHKQHLKDKYGPIASWPTVWQFARIVRNALSHGNKINITDDKTATWRGLTYSAVENGRTVINGDLFPADLIVMLRELENAL